MLRIYYFILVLITSTLSATGQNLVPNSGFELYSICPNSDNQASVLSNWEFHLFSPDYFNSCTTNPIISTPNNWGGYQPSFGAGYVAVSMYADSSFGYSCDSSYCDGREYIGAYLISALTPGTKYYISFFVSPSISDQIFVNCGVDKIGVLFTNVDYSTASFPTPLIRNFAHIVSDSMITDTSSWTKISGSFIADSSYQYMLIGNFFDDIKTGTQILNDSSYCNAYYFIDQVCVSTDSMTCFLNDISKTTQNIFQIYPNPTSGKLRINFPFEVHQNISISLFDILGDKVGHYDIQYPGETIDLSELNSGYYLIRYDNYWYPDFKLLLIK